MSAELDAMIEETEARLERLRALKVEYESVVGGGGVRPARSTVAKARKPAGARAKGKAAATTNPPEGGKRAAAYAALIAKARPFLEQSPKLDPAALGRALGVSYFKAQKVLAAMK